MTRILFICHGNICRSPMAELLLKDMVKRAGIEEGFFIDSAATSSEEIGNPVYPPARKILAEHGISCEGKYAKRMRSEDYVNFDIIIGMDKENIQNMRRCFNGDRENKLHTLLSYADIYDRDIADPWYTRDFKTTWNDLYTGCMGLLNSLVPVVTLDFSACRERKELYEELAAKMLWEKWYGKNLDALNDILTGLPHLGKEFFFRLPEPDAPCREYAERIYYGFLEAGVNAIVM